MMLAIDFETIKLILVFVITFMLSFGISNHMATGSLVKILPGKKKRTFLIGLAVAFFSSSLLALIMYITKL